MVVTTVGWMVSLLAVWWVGAMVHVLAAVMVDVLVVLLAAAMVDVMAQKTVEPAAAWKVGKTGFSRAAGKVA